MGPEGDHEERERVEAHLSAATVPLVEQTRRATYADLEAVSEGKVAELVDGSLYVFPRPAFPHAEGEPREPSPRSVSRTATEGAKEEGS